MAIPEVMCFGDGHFHHVIFGLGPYIANYEEQALLACIIQNWCPKCLALQGNLDQDALSQCWEHTEALVEEFGIKSLWDEYGIVGQLEPFTNDFP
ncbi:hypothetical protein PAXRUDRAFT_169716 [Paxillus rubicundulus Ve08.2h10]|uniref:Uncharacterized protein n=1 Tax=Paxillus rubicundulus Ve08.2h10 TaxID=930991 RepID=A0A0D0DFI8_9AGAM|nr:hypothetical protein PAXRUDRAFT_169716 [Paxillus rubicundulus Ve08.2h10]